MKEKTPKTAVDIGAEVIASMDGEFHDASDRVIAVVGAAYLDAVVEALLRAVFIDDEEEVKTLLSPDRPLGSNGSRYQVAYCLRLITKKQRDDLKMIAKIRNAFAHQFGVRSFEQAEPQKYLGKLHHGQELKAIVEELLKDAKDEDQKKYLRRIAESGRRQFQDTVRSLFVVLLNKLNSVSRAQESMWYPSAAQGAD